MDISLDIRKSIDENASSYFEKAKKAKRKLEGAKKALDATKKRLQQLIEKRGAEPGSHGSDRRNKESRWFEKFRWFISSEGFLCIGGRDAASNEIVVKKRAEKGDIVFHTQMQGSPFFVVKTGGKKPGRATLEEAAAAVASFSRAWRLGLTDADVFYVSSEQLSKTAKPGEYVERGAFVISGKTSRMNAKLELAIGVTKDGMIMCGPVDAVKKNCEKQLLVVHGNGKASDAAKIIRKKLGGDLDGIIRCLPGGGVDIR